MDILLLILLWTAKILIWLILSVIILVVVLLVVPVRYRLDWQTLDTENEKAFFRIKASWFLYFFRVIYNVSEGEPDTLISIGFYSFKPKSTKSADEKEDTAQDNIDEEKKEQKEKKSKKKQKSDKRSSNLLSLLTNADLKLIINLCWNLLKKLLKALKPKCLNVNGVVGFDMPDTTGKFIGWYEAAAYAANMRRSIDIRGDFTRSVFDIKVFAKGSLSAVKLLYPVLWFCLQKPIFKIIKQFFFNKAKVMENDDLSGKEMSNE